MTAARATDSMQGVLCRLVVVSLLTADVIANNKQYYQSCVSNAECVSPFECLSSLCNCDTLHTVDSGHQLCLRGVKYGDPCRETGQCLLELPETYCGNSNNCECAPGYGYDPAASSCSIIINAAVAHGGQCRLDRQCKSGMVCAGQICECRNGLQYDRASLTCIPIVVTRAPGTCSTDAHCIQYGHSVCQNGGCVCQTGYISSGPINGFSCKEESGSSNAGSSNAGSINAGTCTRNQDCSYLRNARCRNHNCVCRPGSKFTVDPQRGYYCSAGAGLRSMFWVALLSLLLSKVAS